MFSSCYHAILKDGGKVTIATGLSMFKQQLARKHASIAGLGNVRIVPKRGAESLIQLGSYGYKARWPAVYVTS